MRLYTASLIDFAALKSPELVDNNFSAWEMVGFVAGKNVSSSGFFGNGIIHNSPWWKNT